MSITRAEMLKILAGSIALSVRQPRALAAAPNGVGFPGVNIAGAEFGNRSSKLNFGYAYPSDRVVERYAALGFKLIRLPFLIQRVQPRIKGEFSSEVIHLDRLVEISGAHGIVIVLDAHNYGQRAGNPIAAADLADFWTRIALRYKDRPHVSYGLMNEPKVYEPHLWRPILDGAVRAIRSTGSKQLLMVPGGVWTGAHSWVSGGNAAALEGFTDPNFMIEVHQYLDSDSSGTHLQEYTPGAGGKRLRAVTEWARPRGIKLFLGEFGFALPAGETEARALLQYMNDNSDVWAAYAYWAGGEWWGNYPFSAEPKDGGLNPQVTLLAEYFR